MNSPKLKLALFIPTFNSQATVIDVLSGIPADILREFSAIYIYDNQSSDQTVQRVVDFAQSHKEWPIEFYRNRENYLLGGSTVLAFKHAIAENCSYLICMHSDGQADPADLSEFVKRCKEDKYDFILGSRLLENSLTSEYSKPRLWANRFFAKIQQPLLGSKVFDLGAYVGFNLQTLKDQPFDRVPTDMAYHPNLILTLASVVKRPLRFSEFPVRWGAVHSSSVNVYTYAIRHLLRIFRLYVLRPNLTRDFSADMKTEKLL